jgi:hypothetical protein
MARVETRQGSSLKGEDTGEEHLDDWFARRLESQGIPVRSSAAVTSRFLAVVGLAAALMAFLWAVSSVGPAPATSSSTSTSTPATGTTGSTPTTGDQNTGGSGGTTVTWKDVTVDVLNGYGGQGAAGTAASNLRAAGWKVGKVGNAGTGTANTYVVYLQGFRKQALAVSKKLGLGQPLTIDQAGGISPSTASGVAIVLGSDGLPPLA